MPKSNSGQQRQMVGGRATWWILKLNGSRGWGPVMGHGCEWWVPEVNGGWWM